MLLALDHVPGNPDRHLRHVATVIRSTTRSDRLLFRPFNLSSLRFSLNSILASPGRGRRMLVTKLVHLFIPDVVEIKRGVDGESLEAMIYNEREMGGSLSKENESIFI